MIDALAISWGVAVVCLFAYVFDIQPQMFETAYAAFDADDFVYAAFILSILPAAYVSRLNVRSDLDSEEGY
jgi:hypothetical protein